MSRADPLRIADYLQHILEAVDNIQDTQRAIVEKDAVTALALTFVNANVHSVHLPDGSHVGNLKRVGTVWKFKAIGYDAAGNVVPGGGPLTDRHNTPFAEPDAVEVNAKLGFIA